LGEGGGGGVKGGGRPGRLRQTHCRRPPRRNLN
jgi:hypothetical protein